MMPVRIIIVGFFVLVTACAPVRPGARAPGGLISGSGTFGAEPGLFDRPVAVTPMMASSSAGGGCGALSEVENYEKRLPSRLTKLGVTVSKDGPLYLTFGIETIYLPTYFGKSESANECLVISEIKVTAGSKESVSWKPEKVFYGTKTFFEDRQIFYLPPDKILTALKSHMEDALQSIVPTVKGKIEDSCGYFHFAPEIACRSDYHTKTHLYDEYMGCARNKGEVRRIRRTLLKNWPEFMKRFSAAPEGPISKPGQANLDSERCTYVRKWILGEGKES